MWIATLAMLFGGIRGWQAAGWRGLLTALVVTIVVYSGLKIMFGGDPGDGVASRGTVMGGLQRLGGLLAAIAGAAGAWIGGWKAGWIYAGAGYAFAPLTVLLLGLLLRRRGISLEDAPMRQSDAGSHAPDASSR